MIAAKKKARRPAGGSYSCLSMIRSAFFLLIAALSLFKTQSAKAFTEITFQLNYTPASSSTIFTDAGIFNVRVTYDETAPYTTGLVEPDSGSPLQGALTPATLEISYNNGQYVGTAAGTLAFFQVPGGEDVPWDGIRFTSESFTSGFGPDGSLSISRAYVFLYGGDNIITGELTPVSGSVIQNDISAAALRLWYGAPNAPSSIDIYPGGAVGPETMFTATTVPEPSTWALLVLGVPALWMLIKRKSAT